MPLAIGLFLGEAEISKFLSKYKAAFGSSINKNHVLRCSRDGDSGY
jgi:hypothetical protein